MAGRRKRGTRRQYGQHHLERYMTKLIHRENVCFVIFHRSSDSSQYDPTANATIDSLRTLQESIAQSSQVQTDKNPSPTPMLNCIAVVLFLL